MIKRLFRKHLRRDLVEEYGASHPQFEEIFNWVYEAPVLEWKIRMYCIHNTLELLYEKNKHGQNIYRGKTKVHMDKAKELLSFLCK